MGVSEMDEAAFETWLREAIEANFDVKRIQSFDEAMVCIYNRGLVIKMDDGSEFQVTIVKSR